MSLQDEKAIRAKEFARKLRMLKTETEFAEGKTFTRDEIVRKFDAKGRGSIAGGTITAWLQGKRVPLDREQAKHLIDVLGRGATPDARNEALATWDKITRELTELKYQPPTPDNILDEFIHANPKDLSSGRYIADMSGLSESAMITKFRNNTEFYTAGKEQTLTAAQIKVTYIRQYPPSDVASEAAKDYFKGLVEWARSDGGHQFQRIIGIPVIDGVPSKEVLEWVRDEHGETADIKNYELRAFGWTPRGDCVNIALMDENVSFFAISGLTGPQDVKGCRVHSRILNVMLTSYFDQLWHGVDPVEKYLRDNL